MDNDDLPVGRILRRREVLALFGGLGLVALVGCSTDEEPEDGAMATSSSVTGSASSVPTLTGTTATTAVPACVVVPERTEGPYFVDGQIERADLVEDRAGVPLTLTVNVSQLGSDACTPLAGAMVDVWHCDAEGVYSGVTDGGFDTTGQTFLRGYQITGDNGAVTFQTIYPGWYSGRTVHIHFKVRTQGADGGAYEFTSQWFFDEDISDAVFATEPYAAKGQRNTLNVDDGIYASDGAVLTLALTGDPSKGFASTFDIGLDLSDADVGASDSAGGGGAGGGPGGQPPR